MLYMSLRDLIRGDYYEQVDMLDKLNTFKESGKITHIQYNELVALMDQ